MFYSEIIHFGVYHPNVRVFVSSRKSIAMIHPHWSSLYLWG